MTRRVVRVELRRRTHPTDDVYLLHEQFVEAMNARPGRWWNSGTALALEWSDELEIQVNLGRSLTETANGYVAYVFRSPKYTRDTAEFDDRLILEVAVDQHEYQQLASEWFPALVDAFLPYRGGVILDEELALEDWDRAVEMGQSSGKDLDGRDGVMRIPPVAFFDEELCLRAFGRAPVEIGRRLRGVVNSTKCTCGGILIVASTAFLARDELVVLDETLRREMSTE